MNFFAFLALIALSVVACHAQAVPGNWTVVKPNFAQLAFLDFWTPQDGYIAAFVSGPGPFMLSTTDGGEEMTQVPLGGLPVFVYAGIDVVEGSEGKEAVAGGVSLLQTVSIQTTDGETVSKSNTTVLNSAFMSVQAVSETDFALFGTFQQRGQAAGSGFAISHNTGQNYDFVNWPYPDVAVSAGQFVTDKLVFAVGTAFPATPDDEDADEMVMDKSAPGVPYKHLQKLAQLPRTDEARAAFATPANETYRSYVCRSSSSGSGWTTVLQYESDNNSTGVALNGVSFANDDVGFVTGTNYTTAGPIAFVLGTKDSGKTWEKLYSLPGGIFLDVVAVSPQEVHVAGGAPGGGFRGNAVVVTSEDGGATWTSLLVPGQALFLDLDVISREQMKAIGISVFQTASLLSFEPTN